jgi:hypothetical protein
MVNAPVTTSELLGHFCRFPNSSRNHHSHILTNSETIMGRWLKMQLLQNHMVLSAGILFIPAVILFVYSDSSGLNQLHIF